MLVIDADAELVAKLTSPMLFGVCGINVFLPALGITPIGLLACLELTAISFPDALHGRWHQRGINRLPTSGNEAMAMQLGIHTMQ